MLTHRLIPSFSMVCFYNSDVNRLPLSLIISRGMPCNRMISLKNSVANGRASRSRLPGMKWLLLVRRSMTTSMVSYLYELGKSVMKSISIDIHGWSGTPLNWSNLYGACQTTLLR